MYKLCETPTQSGKTHKTGPRAGLRLACGLFAAMMLLAGCGGSVSFAKNIMNEARDKYALCQSAAITVVDVNEKKTVEKLAFCYSGNDLTYFYYWFDPDGVRQYEHHDGYILSRADEKLSEWNEIHPGNAEYASYNRERPHVFADKFMIPLFEDAIQSEKIDTMNGGKQVTIEYDAPDVNIAPYAFLRDRRLTSMIVVAMIGPDGYPQNVQIMGDSDLGVYSYNIKFESIDKLEVLQRPALGTSETS